jgi:hypothetical protein
MEINSVIEALPFFQKKNTRSQIGELL